MAEPGAGDPREGGDSFLPVLLLALGMFVLHLVFNNRYGYFRDEFDYMSCGEHPAWGYVDHPPMIPFLVALCRSLFGDSLRSIRLVPALSSSALVLLTAWVARLFGGRGYACFLAALCVCVAPIFLSDGSLLTTNCLEPLFWTGCAAAAVLAVGRREPRYWLLFGLVAGLGLEEKYSIGVFGLGIVAGLLLTKERDAFLGKWIWLGGLLALLVFLPNLLWSIQNHWPFAQNMAHIRASGRDIRLSPGRFFLEQLLLVHFVASPVWIVGVFALLVSRGFAPYRFLGWTYLVTFGLFVALGGKNYYLAPIYPSLFAAGAVVVEGASGRLAWARPALLLLLGASGVWLLPITVPVLSPEGFIEYMHRLPFALPRSEKGHERAVLPQHYADQFGWPELVDVVAEAYRRVPEEERKDCGIFAQNYGQAGAIDFFGPGKGLPKALSGHQSFFLWGPRGYSGRCLVVLDDKREVLEGLFESVEYVGTSDHPLALERHIPVYICRGPRFGSLEALWPRVKRWG
jgi:hypothetical protein